MVIWLIRFSFKSANQLSCILFQSPEPETKGVLLDGEGVTSKKGAKIFTSGDSYNKALEEAGLELWSEQNEEEEPQRAVSGV